MQRRDRLGTAITTMAEASEYTPVVRRIGCLRGISPLTGFGLAVEIGDWHRFTGATIGAFLGWCRPSTPPASPGPRGSITKTGNSHARRLLVEAAWHHRKAYRQPGQVMRTRWDWLRPRPGPAAMTGTGGCTSAGRPSPPATRSR
jgi:transposase